MLTLKGKYNSANVMIDDIDDTTKQQIYGFLNHPAFAHTYIAIMPDCHAGAGAVIGFTAKMNDYVIPNVVGVDIGCGVLAIELADVETIDLTKLDNFIRENIPSGFSIRDPQQKMICGATPNELVAYNMRASISDITLRTNQSFNKVVGSLGTLGGGNHFIEIACTDNGKYWLLIHSGSRNFGLKIAQYHQQQAKSLLKKMFAGADAYKDLEYLPVDNGGREYLADMMVAQEYAALNRILMGEIITGKFFGLPFATLNSIDTVHNYIKPKDRIIRKGAVSAHEGEKLIIPFNMRDGSMLCTGKGNSKWNYSAPHGAGRILSRKKAKATLDIAEFTSEMKGIFSTSISEDTLDESPMAYKDKDIIINAIEETVTIDAFLKPVYNFKAS